MTEDPKNRWSKISFTKIQPCTCSDFNNHYFYNCPDPHCTDIHDTCEGSLPVHQNNFVTTEIGATSDDAL